MDVLYDTMLQLKNFPTICYFQQMCAMVAVYGVLGVLDRVSCSSRRDCCSTNCLILAAPVGCGTNVSVDSKERHSLSLNQIPAISTSSCLH